MTTPGDMLQRLLWITVAVFVAATFIGGSFATGVVWVFGFWLLLIVVGPILDSLFPGKRQKP